MSQRIEGTFLLNDLLKKHSLLHDMVGVIQPFKVIQTPLPTSFRRAGDQNFATILRYWSQFDLEQICGELSQIANAVWEEKFVKIKYFDLW